ncbi:PREDICTED: voltage-dependent T-type calcium channel subunit alpha-1H isoform X4 [Nicrophorus vespilloides]|uniref:Voltage-dependent T-type calcium channel subunit alpha-1H isoform X4 n=1 Tax=Nicrophorus vespilloides TaxID=110193 RepID=A0ABM1M7I0_NICVS|nr:PREDICTED: voltage-dependent T-type calcium channel subunit alpha-1H isoform X4 [Nicrophorus vespilloides]
MIVILLNCVTLGMYQPCMDEDCLNNRCKILQLFDYVIFLFFTLEMMIKMVAMGVWGKGSYLADSWNRLDMFIVLAGGLEYCLDVENLNLSAIRTIRVLRPLRAINRIPSMRILVMLLLDTLPMLGNVLLLCFFVFFIFGIIGVQLWQGILRQRCYINTDINITFPKDLSLYYSISSDQDYICSKSEHSGMHFCKDIPLYKEGKMKCNLTYEEKHFEKKAGCINWNQYYTTCNDSGSNPFQGTISFDNIGLAWIAIFLVISLEGWTDIMYYVQDGHSFWDWIYFVLLIVIGSFFMINLCLVVIATQFSETKKREMERMRLERARFQSSSTLASSTNNSEPTSCYGEIVKYIGHLWRRSKRRLIKKIRLLKHRRDQRRDRKIVAGETIRLNYNKRHHPCCPRLRHVSQLVPNTHQGVSRTSSITMSEEQEQTTIGGGCGGSQMMPKRPSLLRVSSISNQDITTNSNNELSGNLLSPPLPQNNRRRSSVMFSDVVVRHGEDSPLTSNPSSNLLSASANICLDKKNVCSSEKMTQTGDGNIWQITTIPSPQQILQSQQQVTQDYGDLINGETMTCQELLALGGINAALPTGHALDTFFSSLSKGPKPKNGDELYVQQLSDDDYTCCQDMWHCESEYKNAKRSKCYVVVCTTIKGIIRFFSTARRYVKLLVENKYFQQGILLAILINTSSMGIEYHNQPDHLTYAVEVSNIIFSAIFAVEMLLKVISEGPFGYISNGFNVFDGVIVILSAIELFQKYTGDMQADSGLSVLRTFRLLRILKLVRFMPNLRRQLFVMLRTMDNVAIFFSLLILFIFIFSILGMYLFGGKFCKYTDADGVSRECNCEMIAKHDKRCECDRKHFNNFLWATVTVFQILTQEDWNMVLSNGMAKTSHWAALYFVALMTFGNYVLFNLLVAILVEGFSSERNERREKEQREMARRKMSMMESSYRDSSEESSRSISSSSSSYHQGGKNCWRSAEELRKVKEMNGHRASVIAFTPPCDCREFKSPDSEPKCNIQKESKMLKQDTTPSPSKRKFQTPKITHTAATPQDSPSTTLEDFPEFRYSVTPTPTPPSPSPTTDTPPCSTESTQKSVPKPTGPITEHLELNARSLCSLQLLKPPSLSPPPLTYRQFEKSPEEQFPSKIIMHNERIGSKTTTFSEKVSVPKSSDKARIQRKYSWKLGSKSSLKRKKNRSGSDSDAIPLNNGRDHSQCNGSGVSRHSSLRNDSLLQSSIRIQNDTQRDTPNNKSPNGPPLTRHNSLSNSSQSKISPCNAQLSKLNSPTVTRKQSFEAKSVNVLQEEKVLPPVKMDEIVENPPEPELNKLRRLLIYLEPKGCMKERDDYSLYIFTPNNRFRKLCTWLVDQKWFDNVVLLFIACNCITLAMERPNIPPDSKERHFLSVSNDVFTVVFTVEMFVKVVAWGMCYGPDAYFTSGWNIMDGSLVIISIVDLLMSLISESSPKIFGILRVFRLLRSLRPLRVINRAPGLKLVVQTLLSSLRPIGNIVLICCTFFIIFGILGVQLFKGSFYFCKGDNVKGIKNKTDCKARGYDWTNQKYNFDDLGKALMSLFVLSSRDGWVNIMYTGLDAVGVDQQPQTNYSEWRLLYFISFILLVGFFVLNMFVGVVVENFHRCREEQEKEERVRRAAKRALQMEKRRRKMNEPPYYINYSPWRMFIHNVVTSKYFDLAIAAVIGLNVVTMATERYRMDDTHSYILKIFNYFFTAVFILESIMKLVALGFKLYLKEKWNQLDVIIVILSVVGIILEELKSNIIPINPTVLRVMRVMRIARVLKLLKMAKGIRALLDTVMQALPQVGNLGLLFFLLFFIFAALGVELFGRLECSEKHPCQGLGEHADFANFGMAFLTLFRIATGDNWNGIMKDTLRIENCGLEADCVKNCCVSPVIAPIFFVIFVLMAQFVLVNVVVAVLMKHLEESHKHLEDEQDMDNQLEREFQEKQEMEERRELCLALQMDSECAQTKPLTKVLSLPSNFTYNPPGSKRSLDPNPLKQRRQTMHSQQPIMLSNLDDIRNIDESSPDIYSIREYKNNEFNGRNLLQTNVDDIISIDRSESLLRVIEPEEKYPLRKINENLLCVPYESKPVQKMYGSTKNLFAKAEIVCEETPFLLVPDEKKIPKHDSQESVQRIITERRKLDENMKEVNQFDIYDVSNGSEENLVEEASGGKDE